MRSHRGGHFHCQRVWLILFSRVANVVEFLQKKTTVNTFLSAETVSETINFAHLWTLILMLILLINDLNNSKNKINMNLQYVNTLSVDKPVFVNINIKILNTANLPSALLHHINTNLTVNSTDFKINMVVPSTYRRPARCLCASS